MTANRQQGRCDEQLLRGYLEDALSELQQQLVEDHLCECPRCRSQISDSAAGEEWWSRASKYLRGDQWDAGIDTATFFSTAEVGGERSDGRDRLALRQISQWLDPTDDPRMLGRFGGYEILGVIGQGGMGIVLKGFEPSLNRYVAIKVLAPSLATSGTARRRFAREAKAAAAVLHDNVIPIYRVEETRDLPYLVMPYVSDIPLQKRIDNEGPLPLVAILRIGEQIATGLAAAHDHGLVHRDIKPANILLEGGVERVRITDFGLARAADDCDLTRTGVIAGTPQYMSPEQARGDSVDGRSDLFSFGSVMYAMCTGRPPFRAETPYGILRCITDAEPRSIREVNPEIPQWLEAIIAKLHAKRVEDRYASAEDVAELLRQCLAHVQQPTSVALPEECRIEVRPRRFAGNFAKSRFTRAAIVLAAIAVVAAIVIARLGPLARQSEQTDSAANSDAAGISSRLEDERHDEDPAAAWDATASEIEQLLQDARPFEVGVEQFWGGTSNDSHANLDSSSPQTSSEEQNP